MKAIPTLLVALSLTSVSLAGLSPAAPALAQDGVAAARLPNTFDNPAAARTPRPAPTPAPGATPEAPVVPADARSEQLLRTLIAGGQGEGMDYTLMTPALAAQVQPQAATIGPLLQSLGTVQAVDWVGVGDDQDLYVVTFSNGVTQWLIGLTDEGKVSALRFRPAPPPGAAN